MEIKLFCCDFISIFVAAVCEDGRHTDPNQPMTGIVKLLIALIAVAIIALCGSIGRDK